VTVTPPTWRPDLIDPPTLVEEIARIIGYHEIPSILPVAPPGRGLTRAQKARRRAAQTLAAAGSTEVLSYPFLSEATVERGPRGEIREVRVTAPPATAVAEASAFARSLATHGQLEGPPGPIGRTATHDIETDAQGRRRLVRKRVRAL